jgi:hypothetical protein
MPSFYPSYACLACNGTHDLYYSGFEATGPVLSKHWYYTCTKLPVALRVVAGDRWHPVKVKPEGAVEIYRDDAAKERERFAL